MALDVAGVSTPGPAVPHVINTGPGPAGECAQSTNGDLRRSLRTPALTEPRRRAGGRRGGVPKTRRTSAAMRAFAPLYPTPLLFPGPRSVCPILSRVRPLTGPSISHLASGPLEPQCSEAFGRCLGRWKSRPLFDDFRLGPLWWFFPQLSFFGNQ